MQAYLDLVKSVLEKGEKKNDRTNTGTISLFGAQQRFSLFPNFPCLTTKKIHFHSVVHELIWFLKGDTNITYLNANKVKIWDEWADKNGDLGPIYGAQWRHWQTADNEYIDQISGLIHSIKTDPYSRRHIVSSWNPALISKMALPPCHTIFQFFVSEQGKLSCQLYQRSADLFLGVPFNIASYALLTCMIAQVCGLKPKEFIWTGGDVHLYSNHLAQAEEQLKREPYSLPTLWLNPEIKDIFAFTGNDIKLQDYQAHPNIPAPIAV